MLIDDKSQQVIHLTAKPFSEHSFQNPTNNSN